MTRTEITKLLRMLAEQYTGNCLGNCDECPKKALEEAIGILEKGDDDGA